MQKEGFSFVFAHKKSVKTEHFQLNYGPGASGVARLGVVVAKKMAKQAVLRNRVKRRLREVFRHQRSMLPPLDLVFRLTKPLPSQPWPLVDALVRDETTKLLSYVLSGSFFKAPR